MYTCYIVAFQAYRARAEKASGKEIKLLQSDGGGEYINQGFKKYLEGAGIQHRVSTPYSPAQNGLAERMNRTLVVSVRCMLEDSKLPKEFWGPAIVTAGHIHNRLPSWSHGDISPIQHWTGHVPGIGHLRVFGSTTWVHIPKEKRRKLDPKSVKCILIGFEEDSGSKIYQLFDPLRRVEIRSPDVIIDEYSALAEESDEQIKEMGIAWDQEPIHGTSKVSCDTDHDYQHLDPITAPQEGPTRTEEPDILDSIVVRPAISTKNITAKPSQLVDSRGGPELRRSQRNRGHGELFSPQAHFALMANLEDGEPQTLAEALTSSDKAKWKEALESELDSLARNNTWVLEPLPLHRIAVGCRWIFKRKDDGRFKARLVAKGFSQKYGVDYEETFAPVV